MGKPSFPKVDGAIDKRREHIARCAAELIAREGMEGFTMRAVAAASGCSRGLVEHYFKSKRMLVGAADVWINTQTVNRASKAIDRKRGLDALEIRLRQILPFNKTILDEWRVRVIFWRKFSVAEMQEAGASSPFEPIFTAMLDDIVTAQESGEIPKNLDVPPIAEFVLFNVIGIACICLTDNRLRSQESLEERVQMLIAMLRTGDLASVRFSVPGIY